MVKHHYKINLGFFFELQAAVCALVKQGIKLIKIELLLLHRITCVLAIDNILQTDTNTPIFHITLVLVFEKNCVIQKLG